MIGVAVVVPLRTGGCVHRDKAWNYLQPRWEAVGDVHAGSCDGPWVKARAVAAALQDVTADVLVVADGDLWTDGIHDAIAAVQDGAAWAVPHRLVHRLTLDATAAVLAGGPLSGETEQKPYPGIPGGGIVVLRADAYRECPLDPRFVGWGQEDQAWGISLTAVFGEPWRGTADLWHLWHPPQPRMSRSTGSLAGRRVLAEYQAAADEGRMPAYLREIDQAARTRRRITMYVYKNRNSGDVHELTSRSPRLDRLDNWELVAWPGMGDDGSPDDSPVVPRQAEPPVVEQEPVKGPDTDLYDPPTKYASKAEWMAYARWKQVPDCDGMTKPELMKACGA